MKMRKKLTWIFLVALIASIMITGQSFSNPELLLHVDPPQSSAAPGATFDIYVTAGTEGEPVSNLFLAEFSLSWDPLLLDTDAGSINLGDVSPFLDFIYIEQVNNEEGWLTVTVGRPPLVKDGMSGVVQLVRITFLVEAEGSSDLHLYDTRLKNTSGTDLGHITRDGRFEYPIVLTGSIAGEVTDISTGLPIAGATISAVGPETRSTTTAADGTYILADIEIGDYSVVASATGYEDQTKLTTVTEGETAILNFELTPVPTTGTISGTVTDFDTGLPIEGATVTADSYSTTTVADGTYLLADVLAGDYTVEASADGYESASASTTVVAGETTIVDFTLVPIPPEVGAISGTITDADTTEPIEGATVTVADISTSTNAEGYYEIEIEVGTYDVTAEASDYISDTKPATVTTGEITIVDFALVPVLPEVGWIEGVVTDAETALPIEGATVTANGVSVITSADGSYSIEIASGTYTATAEMSGYYSDAKTGIVVEAGVTTTLDFALELIVGWIDGYVTDADTGDAISGATITADGVSVSTDAEGYYKIEIVPGTYTVTVSTSGYYDDEVLDVSVTAGETVTVNFVLTPIPATGTIAGTVTDASTMDPIFGSTVTAVGPETRSTTTVADGTYLLADVLAGDYTVEASADGYESASASTTVVAGETITVDFALVPLPPDMGTIAGTVTDFDTGLPIEGVTVTANGYSATTDSSGYYQIEVLAPETYDITASASGYESETKSVTVTVGETITVDFELTPVPIPHLSVMVSIEPETLNLKSKGRWVTCYIQLPEGYDVENIDVSTVLLEGVIPADWASVQDSVLMIKFDRAAVAAYIRDVAEISDGEVSLMITGEFVDETPFEGSATIKVISKGKK